MVVKVLLIVDIVLGLLGTLASSFFLYYAIKDAVLVYKMNQLLESIKKKKIIAASIMAFSALGELIIGKLIGIPYRIFVLLLTGSICLIAISAAQLKVLQRRNKK